MVQRVRVMADPADIEVQDQEVAVRRRNLVPVRMSVANVLGNNI
jgi:Fe2+ transport system protein FeoA